MKYEQYQLKSKIWASRWAESDGPTGPIKHYRSPNNEDSYYAVQNGQEFQKITDGDWVIDDGNGIYVMSDEKFHKTFVKVKKNEQQTAS